MEGAENKLIKLRKELKKHNIDAFIHPVGDEYMSEYPPASNRRLEWLTGFSGSAGSVAVMDKPAALFTDGRYTLQAANEVDAALYEQHNSGVTTVEKWLAQKLSPSSTVGYDPRLYTRDMLRRMQSTLDKKNIKMQAVPNLIDAIWADRPDAPASLLFIHDIAHAGETSASKRERMAALVAGEGADIAIISAPDAVCWLLNIRARDVENTPLALAVALLDRKGDVTLFMDAARADAAVSAHLGNHVELRRPSALEASLQELKNKNVLCDPASAPVWFTQTLMKSGALLIEAPDICLRPKAIKNPTELQGIANAHIRDGVAIAKLLCWLDANPSVTELDVSERLRAFRAEHPMFVEPSFTTIAGSGPNGAIVHYRVTPESNRRLQQGELFLLDSGGQYPDGTTDITRTVAIGTPSPEHKDRFTRVLKGHIALAQVMFPEGTSGSQLDILARQYLWQSGLDYDHGTGHGVGCFLGVHEGPQRISKRGGDAVLAPGMILSNEPGYYKTGAYGIRIENLVAVVSSPSPLRGEGGVGVKDTLEQQQDTPSPQGGERNWLTFQTLTCAPIDTRLIDPSLLTAQEKTWLNDYHAWVASQLSPLLGERECLWIKEHCTPVA